ncbi:MAG: SufE family protein [Chthoniobacteraceae bacterium]
MNPAARQSELIARLSIIEDSQERLAAVISRAKKWPVPDEAERTEETRVLGCSSRVWLVGEIRDGHCHFRIEADSPLVKGIATLVCEVYDGARAEDIVAHEPGVIEGLKFDRMLSPTRLNGLAAVRAVIRAFAQSQLER